MLTSMRLLQLTMLPPLDCTCAGNKVQPLAYVDDMMTAVEEYDAEMAVLQRVKSFNAQVRVCAYL